MTTEPRTPLNDIVAAGAAAIDTDPANALVTFRAAGVAAGAVGSTTTVRGHTVRVDEPPALGGADTAANPVEVYLASLIACQVVTYRFWAQRLGIDVRELAVDAEGDLDVRGFFGLDDAARPGFRAVRVTVRVAGPEPADRYAELRDAVEKHCPIQDLTLNPTPLSTTLVTA